MPRSRKNLLPRRVERLLWIGVACCIIAVAVQLITVAYYERSVLRERTDESNAIEREQIRRAQEEGEPLYGGRVAR